MSAPVIAFFKPSSLGRYPVIFWKNVGMSSAWPGSGLGRMTTPVGKTTYRDGGDMRQVCSDAGSIHDIVEGKLVDEGARLEEEGQWLCEVSTKA